MYDPEPHEHGILRRFFQSGVGKSAAQLSAEQQVQHAEGGEARKQRGQQHHSSVSEEGNVCRRRKVDVRGVADHERHAPGVCGDKFAYKVRDGVNFGIPREIADERCKREHDDVVGGKYRQHGYKRIEQHEQPQLVCILALQHGDGQMAEESCAVQCFKKYQLKKNKRINSTEVQRNG